jgi:hypothetical protein
MISIPQISRFLDLFAVNLLLWPILLGVHVPEVIPIIMFCLSLLILCIAKVGGYSSIPSVSFAYSIAHIFLALTYLIYLRILPILSLLNLLVAISLLVHPKDENKNTLHVNKEEV